MDGRPVRSNSTVVLRARTERRQSSVEFTFLQVKLSCMDIVIVSFPSTYASDYCRGIMEVEPPRCQFLNEDETEELIKYYNVRQLGWCLAGENNFFLPHVYATQGESIWKLKVRTTDRWVVTFPRSGTTWIQELVWLINSDLNYEEAAKKRIAERFVFLECLTMNKPIEEEVGENKTKKQNLTLEPSIVGKNVESMSSPRFIKTHLPFELLPPGLLDAGCKVVYVARNPKDVIVSLYYMKISRKIITYTGDFSSFWNFFRRNRKLCCPYWAHVKKAWSLRDHPNLLFIFYEEMKKDLPGVIKKASELYGRPCTEDEVMKLSCHMDFDNFKNNPMIGSDRHDGLDVFSKDTFVRKGQIGGWKELFTPELEAQADKWIEENLRDTDLVFPYLQPTSATEK